MKEVRDLKDLTLHDVQPVCIEARVPGGSVIWRIACWITGAPCSLETAPPLGPPYATIKLGARVFTAECAPAGGLAYEQGTPVDPRGLPAPLGIQPRVGRPGCLYMKPE